MKIDPNIRRLSLGISIFIFLFLASLPFAYAQRRDGENRSRIEQRLLVVKAPMPAEADLLAVSRMDDQLFIGDRNGLFKFIEIDETGNKFFPPITVTMNQDRLPLRQILFRAAESNYVLKGNSIYAPKKFCMWGAHYSKEPVRNPVALISDFWSMDFSGNNSACIVGVNLRKEKGQDLVDGGLLICNRDFERNPNDWKTPRLPEPFQNQKISSQLTAIDFVNEKGWLVGANGIIWHSRNGGADWEEQNSGTNKPLLGVYAVNDNNVWAVGFDGTILHLSKVGFDIKDEEGASNRNSRENEKNKSRVDTAIDKIREKFPIDVNIRKNPNDSENRTPVENYKSEWQPLTINPLGGQSVRLWSVKFADDNRNGWIIGESGTILYTPDGGSNWQKISLLDKQSKPLVPLTTNFYAMHIDRQYCWIVGSQGTVVRMQYR